VPNRRVDRPIDSDVDLHDARQRDELHHHHPLVLGAIAVGGVIGAETRYALSLAVKHPTGAWPWSTLLINVAGCLLIGVLMSALARAARPPRLARPFLGTGILGGFTTFSTYAVDVRAMAAHGHPALALGYAGATIASCLLAVVVGNLATRSLLQLSAVPA
jgi:fluoride exporter